MNLDFRFYWSLFLRRLPFMMALLLVCSGFGIVTAYTLPPTYTTSAKLLVEDSRIDLRGISPSANAQEQLNLLQSQLLTRANIIDIANEVGVVENLREMTPDAVVRLMRQNTRIRTTGGRNAATIMSISFSAGTGQIAANVVNEYVTLALEKSTASRAETVESAVSFFEQEVETLSQELDLQSLKIVEFKNANISALPTDLQYRLGRQTLLQERLARTDRDISILQKQRKDLIDVYEATGQVDTEARVELSPEERQLEELQRNLDELLLIYSESNPNVVLLQRRVDALEQTIKDRVPTDQTAVEEPENTVLELTLLEIDSQLEALNAEIEPFAAELEALEQSIAATSGNAITLQGLQREYDNIQSRYTSAVNNLDAARRSERVELSSQGQRISVLEAPTVPQEPSGPNRPRTAAMGVGLGLGLAGGLFFLLEFLNRTIRRPVEIETRFNVTPIATIPYMETRGQKLWRRGTLIVAFLAVLIGVPAALWYVDTNFMPLEIIVARISNRLGL